MGERSFWFTISYSTTKYLHVALAIFLLITIPFAVKFTNMVATSDESLIYLRGSSSLRGLQVMQRSFPVGAINPYNIVMVTGAVSPCDPDNPGKSSGLPNSILTPAYFAAENKLIRELLTTQSEYMDSSSVTGVSFFGGQDVTFERAMSYFDYQSAAFNSPEAAAYRLTAASSARRVQH